MSYGLLAEALNAITSECSAYSCDIMVALILQGHILVHIDIARCCKVITMNMIVPIAHRPAGLEEWRPRIPLLGSCVSVRDAGV